MNHYGSCIIVEGDSRKPPDPILEEREPAPDDRLKKGVDKTGKNPSREDLRPETRALGDPAGDNCGNAGRESGQEKAVQKIKTVCAFSCRSVDQVQDRGSVTPKRYPVGDREAYDKLADRLKGPVCKYFDQSVDLVLLADGTGFQKCKSCMHRKNHHGADHEEQCIGAKANGLKGFIHLESPVFIVQTSKIFEKHVLVFANRAYKRFESAQDDFLPDRRKIIEASPILRDSLSHIDIQKTSCV
jgi:hypothetical protein